jgi:hypothetical protein
MLILPVSPINLRKDWALETESCCIEEHFERILLSGDWGTRRAAITDSSTAVLQSS